MQPTRVVKKNTNTIITIAFFMGPPFLIVFGMFWQLAVKKSAGGKSIALFTPRRR
jgi:hypothetical protein